MLREIVRDFYSRNNFSIRYIASIFKISKSTISRWIKNIIKQRTKKMNPLNIYSMIKSIIESNCFVRLLDIQTKLSEEHKIKISLTTISKYIRCIGITYKRAKKRLFGKDIDCLLNKQKEFRKKLQKVADKNIICVDESGFVTNDCPLYGYGFKGKDVICNIKSNPIKYSLLMAITKNGILAYEIHKNNINEAIYISFLKNKILNKSKNKYVLADNIRFHKTNKVMKALKENVTKPLFIPPYSPQFNSIENVFSIIKQKYRYLMSKSNNKKEDSLKILVKILDNMKNTNFKKIYKNVRKQ